MPLDVYALNIATTEIVNREMTVHLHSNDPGAAANGNANEVSNANGITRPTIASGSGGWSTEAATGKKENTAAVACGTATSAIGSVPWYSLWDGANRVGRRMFAAAMNIADGAEVSIAAATIDITPSSTDA